MAIFHFHQQVITRGQGRSAVAAAAYRHSAPMTDHARTRFEFAAKPEHVHSELSLPVDAPAWARALGDDHRRRNGRSLDDGMWHRAPVAGAEDAVGLGGTAEVGPRFVGADAVTASCRFWNAVQAHEQRAGAQLAHEVDVALPLELTRPEQVALVRAFVHENYTSRGKVADWAFHDKPGNPHVHIMSSLRPLTASGFGPKRVAERDADGAIVRNAKGQIVYTHWAGYRDELQRLREAWAVSANVHLAEAGREERIDHRSHAERGIDTVPTRHRGRATEAMEAVDKESARGAEQITAAARQFRAWEADPSLVLDHLSAEHATFTDRQIAALVYRYAPQRPRAERLMEEISGLDDLVAVSVPFTDPQTGRTNGLARYTTPGTLEREERMIAIARDRAGTRGYGIDETRRAARLASLEDRQGFAFTDEQRMAIDHLTGEAGLGVLTGLAGAGKSSALRAVRELYEAQGYAVVGGALAGKAAQGLAQSAGIDSRTLASWEHAWRRADEARDEAVQSAGVRPTTDLPGTSAAPTIGPNTVFVLDEAGMVASEQMARVLDRLHAANAKVVLVGDARQLQPIEAGAAFRSIAMQTGYVELTEIRRQREAWAADASVRFGRGDTLGALSAYRVRGKIASMDTRMDARLAVLGGWHRDHARGADTLMLAHANRDVRALNEGARELLRAEGRLGNGVRFVTERGAREFAVGDRVLFLKNDRSLGVQNGRLGTVEAVRVPEGGRDGAGSGVAGTVGPDDAPVLSVRLDGPERGSDGRVSTRTIEVAEDGYASVEHGYAATVHKTQGATIDRVHVLATGTMDAQLAYVAMTRHREDVSVTLAMDTFASHEQRRRGEPATPDQALAKLATERLKDTSADYRGNRAHELAVDELAAIVSSAGIEARVARFASVRGLPLVGETIAEMATTLARAGERLRDLAVRLDAMRTRSVGRAGTALRDGVRGVALGSHDRIVAGRIALARGGRDAPDLPELSERARQGLERIAATHRVREAVSTPDRHPRTGVQERRLVQVSRHELVAAAHAGELRRFGRALDRLVDRGDVLDVGASVDQAAMMLATRYPALSGAAKERLLGMWEIVHASAQGRDVVERSERMVPVASAQVARDTAARERAVPEGVSTRPLSPTPTPDVPTRAPVLVAPRTEWQRSVEDEGRVVALLVHRYHPSTATFYAEVGAAFQDPRAVIQSMEATVFGRGSMDERHAAMSRMERDLSGPPAELAGLRGRTVLGRANEERRSALRAAGLLREGFAHYAAEGTDRRERLTDGVARQREAFRTPLPAPSPAALDYARSLRGLSVVAAADVMRGERGGAPDGSPHRLDDRDRAALAAISRGLAERFPFGRDADAVRHAQHQLGTFAPPASAERGDSFADARVSATTLAASGALAHGTTIADVVHAGRASNEAYRTEMILERADERDRTAEREIERDPEAQRGRDREAGM